MNVNEILFLGDDQIRRMSEKEIKEVTTILVSAANKRLKRLEAQAKHTKHGWVERAQSGIATDALNAVSGGALHYNKFSVKDKNRNETIAEFNRLRYFLNLKSSTVKGAKEVRKTRERTTFGKTREQLLKGLKGKARSAAIADMNEQIADIYTVYHRLQELHPAFFKAGDSDPKTIADSIKVISNAIRNGKSKEEALQDAETNFTRQYKEDIDMDFDDIDYLE